MIGRCPTCIGSINIEHLISEKMGLAQFFNIYCNEFNWNQKFCSSKECSRNSNSSGRNSLDLNKRALTAFREIARSELCCNDHILSVYEYASTNGPNNL